MAEYIYTVWFQDNSLKNNDPDFEWPACFIIESTSHEEAKEWGDHLSQKYSIKETHLSILKSEINKLEEYKIKYAGITDNSLPKIKYGYEASNNEIGW